MELFLSKRFCRGCFPGNFVKFFSPAIFQNTSACYLSFINALKKLYGLLTRWNSIFYSMVRLAITIFFVSPNENQFTNLQVNRSRIDPYYIRGWGTVRTNLKMGKGRKKNQMGVAENYIKYFKVSINIATEIYMIIKLPHKIPYVPRFWRKEGFGKKVHAYKF